MPNRPIHFELGVDDPERARRFYQEALGWKIDKFEGPMEYWLIITGQEGEMGIDGGMGRRGAGETTGWVNTLGVEDLDATIERVLAAGGTVLAAKHAVPGVGWLAYFRDTEGNAFGAMQNDPNAA